MSIDILKRLIRTENREKKFDKDSVEDLTNTSFYIVRL